MRRIDPSYCKTCRLGMICLVEHGHRQGECGLAVYRCQICRRIQVMLFRSHSYDDRIIANWHRGDPPPCRNFVEAMWCGECDGTISKTMV